MKPGDMLVCWESGMCLWSCVYADHSPFDNERPVPLCIIPVGIHALLVAHNRPNEPWHQVYVFMSDGSVGWCSYRGWNVVDVILNLC